MEAIGMFSEHWNTIRNHSYITSISEHLLEESQHGRLSMWRAFGGTTARVAIVLNVPWNSTASIALKLLFSPVTYQQKSEAHATLNEVIKGIVANEDFLHSLDRNFLVNYVFTMLVVGVTCSKQEGFKEEREWRAIYLPYKESSDLMESCTKVINGIPQIIYAIPIDERVSPVLTDLEFSRIFDYLIIGPSQYALPMRDAFVASLIRAGIPEKLAEEKARISEIPIRA